MYQQSSSSCLTYVIMLDHDDSPSAYLAKEQFIANPKVATLNIRSILL